MSGRDRDPVFMFFIVYLHDSYLNYTGDVMVTTMSGSDRFPLFHCVGGLVITLLNILNFSVNDDSVVTWTYMNVLAVMSKLFLEIV